METKFKTKFALFFALILFLFFINYILNYNLNTVEGLTSQNTGLISNGADAFCASHESSSDILEQSCSNLTKHNCSNTSCCIWTSNNKCVAGNDTGATFNTDQNGNTIELDYYYYKNKCYGPKC